MTAKPILIIGYGSVGRRHLQNLRSLGYKNFIIYRTGKSTLPQADIGEALVEYDLTKALLHKPIATIITNPSSLHMDVAIKAAKAGSHIFLEKPISHNLDGVKELNQLVEKKNLTVAVGFQFRFHPGLIKIKKLLNSGVIGKIVSVQVHWGEYLPNWHPWEDYRQSYAARNELGGGVLLTLCHPFDYLRWLFGEITDVFALEGRDGGLFTNVEDSADILLKFKSHVISNVHLDYLERPAEHYMRIIGQNGTIFWNNFDSVLKWQSHKDKNWKQYSLPQDFERNDLFLAEMKIFLLSIKRKEKPICTLSDGISALKIVFAIKKSIKEKRYVKL